VEWGCNLIYFKKLKKLNPQFLGVFFI